MDSLFETLSEQSLFDEWAVVLDWLFDDNKFDSDKNWEKKHTSQFTKQTNKLPELNDDNYVHKSVNGKKDNLVFPKKRKNEITILIGKSESKGKDLVRHIRNGIAHGRSKVINNKGELYIEIKDYTNKNKQSAYIYMPLSYIREICKIYKQIEKSIKNQRKGKTK